MLLSTLKTPLEDEEEWARGGTVEPEWVVQGAAKVEWTSIVMVGVVGFWGLRLMEWKSVGHTHNCGELS
jgi:hypothetical protein